MWGGKFAGWYNKRVHIEGENAKWFNIYEISQWFHNEI